MNWELNGSGVHHVCFDNFEGSKLVIELQLTVKPNPEQNWEKFIINNSYLSFYYF